MPIYFALEFDFKRANFDDIVSKTLGEWLDHASSVFGKEGEVILLDLRAITSRTVPLSPGVVLLLVDSGVPHKIAATIEGVLGARLIGGGFGGSTIWLVERDKVQDILSEVSEPAMSSSVLKAGDFCG